MKILSLLVKNWNWTFLVVLYFTLTLKFISYILARIVDWMLKTPVLFFHNNKWGIFPSIFYCCYLVVKTQSSIEFQNSIFHPFHFNNSYFIAVVKVLFLIYYPLEKHFRKGYIFTVSYSGNLFSSNLAVFKSQNIFHPFMGHHGGTLRHHKTQSSNQKRW